MTPIMPTGEPLICRHYSVPASLLAAFDSAIGQCAHEGNWTRGDDPTSATVADVLEAYNQLIEKAYETGCRMVGEILELATDTVPSWALLCDGTTYANVDYPELAAVISAGLVVDADHFRTPDRVSRIGMGGQPTGFQGGENTHVLTVTEMPSHSHDNLAHEHTTTIPFGEGVAVTPGELPVVIGQTPAPTGLSGVTIFNTGGGAGHNNLQQYEGTVFVIVATSHD